MEKCSNFFFIIIFLETLELLLEVVLCPYLLQETKIKMFRVAEAARMCRLKLLENDSFSSNYIEFVHAVKGDSFFNQLETKILKSYENFNVLKDLGARSH